MSAKACQLCGKPLSRLRVGADPDFCSKDHRNQFRLRRGMDRLVEVNKVANLMRRRESPRQITVSSLMCQSAITPRGYYDALPTGLNTTPFHRPSRYQMLEKPRITARAEQCAMISSARQPGEKTLRHHPTGRIRIRNLNPRPEIRRGRWSQATKVAQAPPRNLHHRAPAEPKLREFNLLRQSGIRVHLGAGPAALRRASFCGTETLSQGLRQPGVRFAAAAGKALRVSIAKGFVIPKAKVRKIESQLEMRSALVYPKQPMAMAAEILKQDLISRSMAVSTTAIALRLPPTPRASHTTEFPAQHAKPPVMGAAVAGALPTARHSGIDWKPAGPQWSPGEIHTESAGFARRNGARLKRLAMLPYGVTSTPQVTFARFIPQDPKGCPVVPFQAVIAGGAPPPAPAPGPVGLPDLADAPAAKPASHAPAAVVHFEEHFEGGWDNWVGGVDDWKVDVAGVRTGTMALFLPTLDLSDYTLEFFARIDSKSINWVVRAAGADQHLRCTLTALDGNQLEFSRTLVTGGAAEGSVVAATRVPGKRRSAVTIRTNVSGDSFAVTVDGKAVDTWTETRLPSGGIGFTGTPEDRARLYWVKVSSSQSTGKE